MTAAISQLVKTMLYSHTHQVDPQQQEQSQQHQAEAVLLLTMLCTDMEQKHGKMPS
jgi:hypothetical protein